MKKLSLVIAAAAAILALAGCKNGAQEVAIADQSVITYCDYYYDVEGTITEVEKEDGLTLTTKYTATDKTIAEISWYKISGFNTNSKDYTISIDGLDMTLPSDDNKTTTIHGVPYSFSIQKIGDNYYHSSSDDLDPSSSKFAGNDSLILVEGIKPENKEFTLKFTYSPSDDETVTVDLTFTRL